jgi:hypothetical protein
VEAKNSKGDIEVSLAPNASANVNVHTHNGDIVSDYNMPSLDDSDNKSATFQIGSGSARIVLNTDNGDIHIKKGSAFPATPQPPSAPEAPGKPEPPAKAPHLKAPKAPQAEPVTQ